jgi:aspartyl-tRNA synthetase
MDESLSGMKRTNKCGTLGLGDVGREVTVMGWAHKRRDLGGVIFVDLRDISGIVQVVFRSELNRSIFEKAESIRNEYVLAVRGEVVKRDPETVNPKIATGEVEIVAKELRILSRAETPPLAIEEDSNVNEATRLRYRYLDLRRPDMQRNLVLRHKVAKITRDYFSEKGFLEIETPMLTRSTPEGARDYLVPSRVNPGRFYALPQSPQLFKQLLMVSGYDRYFQIVRCFRDEDFRADRQAEFTQIDLEMSFVDIDDVIEVNEGFIKRVFENVMGIELKTPFIRIPYKEAMSRFGSDRPDTRFGLELVDLSDIVKDSEFKVFSDAVKKGGSVRAINAKGCGRIFSRREIDALADYVKDFGAKGMAWILVETDEMKSPVTKFLSKEELDGILKRVEAEPGDLVCFVADKDAIVFDALGHLRLELAKQLNLIKENMYNFLWVTEFPLLEYNEDENRWDSIHHPFTSPMDEDIEFLESDPARVRSKAYDIVLNGTELGGGSIRIHSSELQSRIFKLLGFSEEQARERFGFLLDAFRYGTPPHGGIAYGFDRLIMLLAGMKSIRDVIAFPKVQNASCLMTGAPGTVDEKQLKELHIRIAEQE